MDQACFQFPAIRGIQAGREYYTAMCPLKLVPRLLVFDDAEVPTELRAQRVLNKARIPEIARYLVENSDNYVLSSVTACIDGEVNFVPLGDHGNQRNAGLLNISMESRILVNDGQHRRAAITEALKMKPSLGNESISVVFFIDAGLKRSQQWFADLNKHAVRPTQSLSILYDHRDALSGLARDLEQRVPIFRDFTEVEKTTISNRSIRLFTLSAVYQASVALLNKKRNTPINQEDVRLAAEFWTELSQIIPEWQAVIRKEMRPSELRNDYIVGHGVTLQALGIAGRCLISTCPSTWKERLAAIENIDWRRNSVTWNGRALIRGKLSKSRDSILLTTNVIKEQLALPLSTHEQALEDAIHQRTRSFSK